MNPNVLPATTHSYLMRAAESLSEAMTATEVPTRYACAHVAALRAAAALLAARAQPAGPPGAGRRRTPGCCWPRSPPSWPSGRRSSPPAPASGRRPRPGSRRAVTEREADDLVRDADRFLAVVEETLGLGRQHRPTVPPAASVALVHLAARRVGEPACPTPSSTCTSPPATPCATAPRTRTSLVERAAEHGMDTLALTDRDGIYGAVKFARAAVGGDPAGARRRPRPGADRARRPPPLAPALRRRAGSPARGGAGPADAARLPRVHLPATRGPRPGRLGGAVPAGVGHPPGAASAARPVEHPRPGRRARRRRCGGGRLLVLLGPGLRAGPGAHRPPRRPRPGRSSAGGATLVDRRRTCASRWSPTGRPARRPGYDRPHAARMARARPEEPGSPRCSPTPSATPTGPTPPPSTCSTPPAGWSPLDPRHVDRRNAEGFLKSGKEMAEVAEEIARLAGLAPTPRRGPAAARRTPARWPTGAPSTRAPTSAWARCTSRSSSAHHRGAVPRPDARVASAGATGCSRARCEAGRSAAATAPRPRPRSGSGSTTSWR